MAVKIRLRREGKKKQPFYRVVVADVRAPRDGGFIDDLGYYQPLHEPSTIAIDRERALKWLRDGAQPSDAVVNLLRIQGIWEEFRPGDPGKDRSAKHAARAAKAEQREAKAREEADAARREREEAEAAAAAQAASERAAAEQAQAEQAAAEQAPGEQAPAEQTAPEQSAAGPATASADKEVVARAVEEVTQPDAQPPEDTGALPPADEAQQGGGAGGQGPDAAGAETAGTAETAETADSGATADEPSPESGTKEDEQS